MGDEGGACTAPESSCDQSAGDPVDVASGVYLSNQVTDARLVGALNDDIVFRRSYSTAATALALPIDPATDPRGVAFVGAGWSHSYRTRIVDSRGTGGGLGLVLDDGRFLRFTQSGGAWQPPEGSSVALEEGVDEPECDGKPNPSGFKATLDDGRRFYFGASGRFARWRDRAGYGVCASYGADGRLTFLRNSTKQEGSARSKNVVDPWAAEEFIDQLFILAGKEGYMQRHGLGGVGSLLPCHCIK